MTIRTSSLVLFAVGLLAGCSRDVERAPPVARDVAARGAGPFRKVFEATQNDLAIELEQAERRGTWNEVKQRWQGQQVRWTVTRHRALCKSSSACNVAPFAIQRPAQNGWLPGLQFAPGEFGKLEAACGRAEQCELEFEGTLTDFALSPELPTSLRFSNVRVVSARAS